MHLDSVTIHPDTYPVTDKYPFNLPVFSKKYRLEFTTPVTCFVGENGTGKSTLLEGITRKCGIHIWGEVDRERYEKNPYENAFYTSLELEWDQAPGSFFASQTFRSYTRLLDEWASADPGVLSHYGGKSLVSQSHGQSLMAYFRNRYSRRGLYFLDEPETALSAASQVELKQVIEDVAKQGYAQFVIATHSPILMAINGAVIYSFDTSPVSAVHYDDIEHVKVYRDFFALLEERVD